jgi:hypothetical protein
MVSGADVGGHLDSLAVVALWGVFAIFLAVRGFTWEARRA